MTISAEELARVTALLGRQPRGLEAIAVATADGMPMVIRVASLVDDKPFPTLFWLVDRDLSYRIDQAEAGGLIRHFQRQVDADPELQGQMRADHRAHIALRASHIPVTILQRLQALGFGEVLNDKGIGGIGDYTRVRCLHTWYAAHLVVANSIGAMLDDWWREQARAARMR